MSCLLCTLKTCADESSRQLKLTGLFSEDPLNEISLEPPICEKLQAQAITSFKCDTCDKVLPTSHSLRKHSRTHSAAGVNKCEICGRCFSHAGHLKDHVRSHTGEKPFKCDYCGKVFSRSGRLKIHAPQSQCKYVDQNNPRDLTLNMWSRDNAVVTCPCQCGMDFWLWWRCALLRRVSSNSVAVAEYMSSYSCPMREALATKLAFEWLLTGMPAFVASEAARLRETLSTVVAFERFFTRMPTYMTLQVTSLRETLPTNVARKWSLAGMLRTWLLKLLQSGKHLAQISHLNGFSPV
ncbi:hypothetical protein ANN_27913 [Periplaneta americana]|uniref:C2H2-type domain-containing protein n=1 Tax=Periplaneta americana TaxID=6978 RepID=A0ABQ8RVS3_PERAM|nr:hypothetical protein ANN_27913 [Periplaneta americana]